MKKFIATIAFIGGFFGITQAYAQNQINNGSDFGVPVPVSTPQQSPSISLNALNTPALTVPSAPPVVTLPAPVVSVMPSLTPAALLPAVPAVPSPPPAPGVGFKPPVSTFSTTLSLPSVPTLPPLPPIPAMPDVRLPIGVN